MSVNSPTAGKGESLSPLSALWAWLNSLPIAIAVMAVMTLLAAVGTIIPQWHMLQGDDLTKAQVYIEKFGQAKYDLINMLGLNRIYFTGYFFLLMLWLAVSAIACNVTRFKRTFGLWVSPPVERPVKGLLASKHTSVFEGTDTAHAAELAQHLKEQGFRVRHLSREGMEAIYADKGFWKKWGLLALHFSLIVLLFGAVYGSTYGVGGLIQLKDGEQTVLRLDPTENKYDWIKPVLKRLTPEVFDLDQGKFRIDYDKNLFLPSDFSAESPEVQEYYRYFVRDFVSTLKATHRGRSKQQEVKVNHPLELDGLTLYQSSYQQDGYLEYTIGGETKDVLFPAWAAQQWMLLTPSGPQPAEEVLSSGVAHGDVVFMLEPIKAGDIFERGQKTGYLGPMTLVRLQNLSNAEMQTKLLEPGKQLEMTLDGKPASVGISKKVDNYSVFEYKRSPGMWILWTGWIVMIIGITIGMYISFGQAWIRLEAGKAYMLYRGPGADNAGETYYTGWRDILVKP